MFLAPHEPSSRKRIHKRKKTFKHSLCKAWHPPFEFLSFPIESLSLGKFYHQVPISEQWSIHRPVRGQSSKIEFSQGANAIYLINVLIWIVFFGKTGGIPRNQKSESTQPTHPDDCGSPTRWWQHQSGSRTSRTAQQGRRWTGTARPCHGRGPPSKLPIRDVDNFNRNSSMMVNDGQCCSIL